MKDKITELDISLDFIVRPKVKAVCLFYDPKAKSQQDLFICDPYDLTYLQFLDEEDSTL